MKTIKPVFVIVLIAFLGLFYITYFTTPHSTSVKYTLYGYDSCPYTLKMKHELEKHTPNYVYKQIDKNETYRAEYASYNVKGVPLVINNTTGKHYLGFTEFSNLV